MIESTFLHLPRTGKATEQRLWKAGIVTWQDFLRAETVKGFPAQKKQACDQLLHASSRALHAGDSAFFRVLPTVQHWRLYPQFSDETIYVDIETSWHGDITVLGIYDGKTVKQFTKGVNLNAQTIREHLQGKLIVTYNGASFDLPVIERCFPGSVPAIPHFDTMHLARRLGYRGGLKALERELGISRPSELEGMSGQDALTLWALYKSTGEDAHLKRLLAYNEEDIVNLVRVASMLVAQAQTAYFENAKSL